MQFKGLKGPATLPLNKVIAFERTGGIEEQVCAYLESGQTMIIDISYSEFYDLWVKAACRP